MTISFLLGYGCDDVGRFRPATLRFVVACDTQTVKPGRISRTLI
nr:MAG TPA: hypothetical protein [Bacteriophage sp.]